MQRKEWKAIEIVRVALVVFAVCVGEWGRGLHRLGLSTSLKLEYTRIRHSNLTRSQRGYCFQFRADQRCSAILRRLQHSKNLVRKGRGCQPMILTQSRSSVCLWQKVDSTDQALEPPASQDCMACPQQVISVLQRSQHSWRLKDFYRHIDPAGILQIRLRWPCGSSIRSKEVGSHGSSFGTCFPGGLMIGAEKCRASGMYTGSDSADADIEA